MKKTVTAFTAGALVFGTIGVFAGQYTATENAFPVQLNGENVNVEGYNIEGSTYFKLRDIADIIGGFDVGFHNNTIQLAMDGYVYDNTEDAVPNDAEVAQKPFVDEVYLDENGCATVQYDLDFDGGMDAIEMRQSRSFENSDDGTMNCLKTELIINGETLLIDNAYKTHGCQRMFIADIDQTDNSLEVVVCMSYKSTSAHIFRYKDGQIIQSYCATTYAQSSSGEAVRRETFPIGNWGTQPEGIRMRVNDNSYEETGFYFDVPSDDAYYYKKTGENEYERLNVYK